MSLNVFLCSGLETFWQSAFAWFFRPYLNTYGHLWTLKPTELRPLSYPTWHTTNYLAKVRFLCQVNFILLLYTLVNVKSSIRFVIFLLCVIVVQAWMDFDEGTSCVLVSRQT